MLGESQGSIWMDVRIMIETEFENGDVRRHDLGRLSRPTAMICGEAIGGVDTLT
jgi:hypothetical protein